MPAKQPGVGKGNYNREKIVAQRKLEMDIFLGKVKPPQVIHEANLATETDDDIDLRIRERFRIMGKLTDAVIAGHSRAEIIAGPPGLGKSYGIEQKLKAHDPEGKMFAHVRGFARATGVYKKLYETRHKGSVLCFDDADSIFNDETSLNLLKAACDTTEDRVISYLAETTMVDEVTGDSLPTNFVYEGSIIFITNYDFDDMIARGDRNAVHFQALMSRAHYLNLLMTTPREYMIRVKQVAKEGLFSERDIDEEGQRLVIDYMDRNKDVLREVSLRQAIKIADLYITDQEDWEMMANITTIRTGARPVPAKIIEEAA